MFFRKKTHIYEFINIKDLRVVSLKKNLLGQSKRQHLFKLNELFVFSHGAKKIRFGRDIDETEAKQIFAEIQKQLVK